MLYLNYMLELKNQRLSPGDKFSVATNASTGDIRKLLDDTQSKISGYSGTGDNYLKMDIENAINKLFSCTNPTEALDIILSTNMVFSNPNSVVAGRE